MTIKSALNIYVVNNAKIVYNKHYLYIKVIDIRIGDVVLTVPASEVQKAMQSGELDMDDQASVDEYMGNHYMDQLHDMGVV
jgi:hypothetical protein